MAAYERVEKSWTTRGLLDWTHRHFETKGIDHPRLAAEMLLAHVLETTRIKLYMDPDRPASELERAAFRSLVERASAHEPVDYLVGHSPFFSLDFVVTPDVLIPRPSTETAVEHVIQHVRRVPGFSTPLIADICTGSGCIAIALAKHMDQSRIIATDISDKALAVAKTNAQKIGVSDRIDFLQGDLLAPVRQLGRRVRYLVTNPPYISDAEWHAVEPNVKNYEPVTALRGGSDGLDFIRPLIAHAHEVLDKPGQLVLEFAASQHRAVLEMARNNPHLVNAHILSDHEGLARILIADAKG